MTVETTPLTLAAFSARRKQTPEHSSRIQLENRAKIMDAAIQIFSIDGYRGATLDKIAEAAKMSKPNLIYYYASKEILYLAILQHIVETWLEPLEELDENNDPEGEISKYIDKKMEFARMFPAASRVFSKEISAGAPLLKPILVTYVRGMVKKKVKVIRNWMSQSQFADLDPYHVVFAIWAITQHYADFEAQIEAVTGKTLTNDTFYEQAKHNVCRILLHGILTKPQ